MQILNGSIDLTKIDKSKIITTDKNGQPFKNGAKYINISVIVGDEVDKFGNLATVTLQQTKEEREAKEGRVYIGNLKLSFNSNDTKPVQNPKDIDGNDNLPF